MNQVISIERALSVLSASISSANAMFDKEIIYGEVWSDAAWRIEKCFLQLMTIAEVLGLNELRRMIVSEYENSKNSKSSFMSALQTPDCE